ncbi:hypothetical protein A3754_08010 [Alcanivorax sp. HI0083]|uniref:ATP-dependent nuclease n=1 Tax=unclassified Alcanivorax TaxID=2638842 RepID=UPI0007B8A522|nr:MULTISPECIES: AAA family ATPase [unclassified Alcanivorax]KZY38764.1 hypothetical protein A3730_09980 [Alcanivorax sp. HI0044]KZZ27337.1 hypothetical protein A3754_08010 [Alcanivorax sp. HI0083]
MAKLNDLWKKALNPLPSPDGIKTITQHPINGCETSKDLDRITIVVGANGAGKSSFLEYLFTGEQSKTGFPRHTIETLGGITLNLPGDRTDCTKIDPAQEIITVNKALTNLQSTFDQYEEREFETSEVAIINFILCTSWHSISVEEIDDLEGSSIPRFICRKNEITVDSLALSFGELSVLYLYWRLIKKENGPKVILVDEPEAGLSPLAQRRLEKLFVYAASEKAKQLILATHSPFIVEWAGHERSIVITQNEKSSWSKANSTNYIEELGLEATKKKVFVFEDNKSVIFFKTILDYFGSRAYTSAHLIHVNGEGNVEKGVTPYQDNPVLSFVGILDADQKSHDLVTNAASPFIALPGNQPPEIEAIKIVTDNIDEYSERIGVRKLALETALRRHLSEDHHDFFENLSRSLYGEARPSLFEIACKLWVVKNKDDEETKEFLSTIDPDLGSD